jgi:hypothetical protein
MLMPSVVDQLEQTIVAVLESIEHGARIANHFATPAASATASTPHRLTLPQAPQIRR